MQDQIKLYVAGFMFLPCEKGNFQVALIRKKNPEWQAGLLNGIGGKIEPGETPIHAMRREFLEETGVAYHFWEEFVELRGPTTYDPERWAVHFFRTVVRRHVFDEICAMEDEPIEKWYLDCLFDPTHNAKIIPNLSWLIPMALGLPFKIYGDKH